MTTVLFDTHKLAKNLVQKGAFSPEQADILTEALGEAMQDSVATKGDIQLLRSDLSALEHKLSAKMYQVAGGQLLVLVGIIIGAAKYFGH